MTLGLVFWILMLVWLAFGLYINRATPMQFGIDSFPIFILFLLLGWKVFGPPIHG